jgi:hypothetical protein
MRGTPRAIHRSFDHPLPWLMASVAVAGLVAGLAPTGVIATQHDLDNALRTQELSREALRDISVRLPELHSNLTETSEGSRRANTRMLADDLEALDAAWGQYLRMPATGKERDAAGEAWAEYRQWRWEVALPAIEAVEAGAPLAPNGSDGSRPGGMFAHSEAAVAVQELHVLNQKESHAEVASAWREYRLRTGILVGASIAGILVALGAAMASVSRMRPPDRPARRRTGEIGRVGIEEPAAAPLE